ncbi:MAG: rhomboid family intramembrane serine protease [Gammaproteobacteria bacterium]
MIIPFSAELSLNKWPYVTLAIILLCLLIHYFQVENRQSIESAAARYCESIHNPYAAEDSLDYLREDTDSCLEDLFLLHSLPDSIDVSSIYDNDDYTAEEFDQFIAYAEGHRHDFGLKAPASMDDRLSYSPDSFNPVTSLLSALAHADWWHVIGNLIFLIAFAPALELLVGSALKYLGILILIEFVCDFAYSLASLGSPPVPTLGLSGVVSGVIGLSAYMMPWARIRTLVWYFVFIRVYYIPAWVLALWFVSWDLYYLLSETDNGGVNFLAHVSGAVAGYLIGVLWLSDRRKEVREDLDEAVEHTKSQRTDQLGTMSLYKGGKDRIADEQREHRAREQYNCFMDELHLLVDRCLHSEASLLFLKNYELYSGSIEIYEEIFWEMHKWRQGRSLLCLGRLNIGLLLEHRKYARLLAIAGACVEVDKDFVLANSAELLLLVGEAQSQMQYILAYQLIRDAKQRYGDALDAATCQLIEADLLEHHLNKPEEAQKVLARLPDGTALPAMNHQ